MPGGPWESDLRTLATNGNAEKVARRDLPRVIASGHLGATTVSATLWAAARAGVEVTTIGGIGGVHVGSGDVSADLLELARSPGTLVCSVPKSIVDPVATLERIEELGIGVVGYRCERLPFFLVRETDIRLEHLAASPEEVGAISRTRQDLGVASALLVCNPVPGEHAMDAAVVKDAVQGCICQADAQEVKVKEVTPLR